MTKLKKIITSAALLTAAGFSYSAYTNAQDNSSGLYLGANYGFIKVDSADDFDDDADVVQGLVGYRFNPFIAVEGGYTYFGHYGSGNAKAETDGVNLGLKLALPIADVFSVYAKAGQIWTETDYRYSNGVFVVKDSDDDEALYYGIGASFSANQHWLINLEYVQYDADLDVEAVAEDLDDTDVETDFKQVSLGVEYRF